MIRKRVGILLTGVVVAAAALGAITATRQALQTAPVRQQPAGIGAGVAGAAALWSAPSIQPLLEAAREIVVGDVVSLSDDGPALITTGPTRGDGRRPVDKLVRGVEETAPAWGVLQVSVMQARVRVVGGLKGDAPGPGETVTLEYYQLKGGAGGRMPQVGGRYLFLLDGAGRAVDVDVPALRVGPGVSPDGGLEPRAAAAQCMLDSLRADAPLGVLEPCAEGVIQLQPEGATETFGRLADDPSPAVRALGLWGLVELGDERAFPTAAEFLQRPPANAGLAVGRLKAALGRVKNPDRVSQVTRLLRSEDPAVREAAALSLRQMRSSPAMPALAGALSDPAPSVAYQAVMGLAEHENRSYAGWATSWMKFDRDPAPYVERWKAWWEKEGKAKYGG